MFSPRAEALFDNCRGWYKIIEGNPTKLYYITLQQNSSVL